MRPKKRTADGLGRTNRQSGQCVPRGLFSARGETHIKEERRSPAAIYLRDSSEQQRLQGTSIPAQRKACLEHCERHLYRMVHEYVDDGFSGRTLKRDAFIELLRDARARPRLFDVIVLYDTDRFDRSRDAAVELDKLRQIGVRVEYVVFPMQYDRLGRLTPESALTEDQKKAFDRYFSLKLGRDVLRGNKEVSSRGFRVGGSPPYGYRFKRVQDGSATRSTLEPDPQTSETVRKIFAMKADGVGDRKIAEWLDQQKIAPPRRPRRKAEHSITGGIVRALAVGGWAQNTVRNIILNRTYMGELTYNRRTWLRDFGSQSRRPLLNPRSEWLVIPGAHDALVTQELFDAAGALRTQKRPRAERRTDWHVYLLSGLVRCAQCNAQAWSQKKINGKGRAYYYYRCHGNVDSNELERAVVETLRGLVNNSEEIEAAWKRMSEGRDSDDIKRQQKKVADLERKMEAVIRAIEDGAPLAKRCAELQRQIEAEQDRLTNLSATAKRMPRTKADLVAALDVIASNLDVADRAELRVALKAFIHEVLLDFKKHRMTVSYSLPSLKPCVRREPCGGLIGFLRTQVALTTSRYPSVPVA